MLATQQKRGQVGLGEAGAAMDQHGHGTINGVGVGVAELPPQKSVGLGLDGAPKIDQAAVLIGADADKKRVRAADFPAQGAQVFGGGPARFEGDAGSVELLFGAFEGLIDAFFPSLFDVLPFGFGLFVGQADKGNTRDAEALCLRLPHKVTGGFLAAIGGVIEYEVDAQLVLSDTARSEKTRVIVGRGDMRMHFV